MGLVSCAMTKRTTHPHRRLYQFDDELMSAINDFRFSARIGSESEAVRRLIRIGLEVEGLLKPEKRPKPEKQGKVLTYEPSSDGH